MKKIALFIIIICSIFSCKDDESLNPAVQPLVQTLNPIGVTCEKAILVANELNGGGKIIERGFIYIDNSENAIKDGTPEVEVNKILSQEGTKLKASLEDDFQYILEGLTKETEYCVQAYIIGEQGKSYGHPILFQTSQEVPPTVSIVSEYEKEENTTNVIITANLDAVGGSDITEQGLVWSNIHQEPTLETGEVIKSDLALGKFKVKMENLQMLRKYYVRAFAKNKYGNAYSSTLMVLFMNDKFIDARDNEEYTVQQYGNSVWMTQNFRYIPENGINKEVWVQEYTGNSVEEAKASKYYKTYGCLYTLDMAKKIAPEGWHLATDEEWKELEIQTGMNSDMANLEDTWRGETNDKLKSEFWEGIGPWNNELKFNLHPGGKQWCGGAFQDCNQLGFYWTSTINENRSDGQLNAYYRFFSSGTGTGRFSDFPSCVGLSVRYVMD